MRVNKISLEESHFLVEIVERVKMFLTKLEVEKVEEAEDLGRAKWRLLAPLVFESELMGKLIEVEAGFETDFASVPRWVLPAFALTGDTAHASAVLHDYAVGVYTKDDAAQLFLEAMKAEKVPTWRRWLMYLAVQIF